MINAKRRRKCVAEVRKPNISCVPFCYVYPTWYIIKIHNTLLFEKKGIKFKIQLKIR